MMSFNTANLFHAETPRRGDKKEEKRTKEARELKVQALSPSLFLSSLRLSVSAFNHFFLNPQYWVRQSARREIFRQMSNMREVLS